MNWLLRGWSRPVLVSAAVLFTIQVVTWFVAATHERAARTAALGCETYPCPAEARVQAWAAAAGLLNNAVLVTLVVGIFLARWFGRQRVDQRVTGW